VTPSESINNRPFVDTHQTAGGTQFVATLDGIVQNSGQSTANRFRTPALRGTRTKSRQMHDGYR